MRGDCASEDADSASLCDESFDVLLGPALAAHRLNVEFLEALFQPVEGTRVGAEHPFEQGCDEGRTVEHAGVART